MWKFFCQKIDKWISYQKLENTNIGRLSAKVVNNDRTHCDDIVYLIKMCYLYVVLVLQGSVETQLGWSGKFYYLICRVFLSVSTGTKIIKIEQVTPEL